jgi:hypothetical protein
MADEAIRIYKVPEAKIKIVNPESGFWPKNVLEVYKSLKEAVFNYG